MCAVARRTLGFAVIIARSQHVGCRLGIAVECHAVELQDGVAVYVKCSCEVIAARLYRHTVDIALTRGITRGVQRRLNRDIGAEVLDLGRADIKLGLTADILSAVGGRERDAAESHCERAGKRGSCDFSVETSQKLTSNSLHYSHKKFRKRNFHYIVTDLVTKVNHFRNIFTENSHKFSC